MLPPTPAITADDRGHDAGAVAAVDRQHPRRRVRPRAAGGHLADGHGEAAVGGERRQRLLDLGVGGRALAHQHHREVTAQQRHRRVLEVEAQPGELVGGLGDDAGTVVAEDGDGVEGHRIILSGALARPKTSSVISRVSRLV